MAASADGRFDPARLAGFRRLQREVAAEAGRSDPLLGQAAVSMWKATMKWVRPDDKRRRR